MEARQNVRENLKDTERERGPPLNLEHSWIFSPTKSQEFWHNRICREECLQREGIPLYTLQANGKMAESCDL